MMVSTQICLQLLSVHSVHILQAFLPAKSGKFMRASSCQLQAREMSRLQCNNQDQRCMAFGEKCGVQTAKTVTKQPYVQKQWQYQIPA